MNTKSEGNARSDALRTKLRQPDGNSRPLPDRPVLSPSPQAQTSIGDRIDRLHEEIEAIIAARLDVIAEEARGVPRDVLRKLLAARSPACLCGQYRDLPQRG